MVVPFVVCWHRLVLLGPNATLRSWFPVLKKRDRRFIGYFLLMSILVGTVILVIGIVQTPVILVLAEGSGKLYGGKSRTRLFFWFF